MSVTNLVLTLLIAVLAAASSFLPATGTVYDNSTRVSGLKRIRPRGWWTIVFIIVLIGINVIQSWYNQKETEDKEIQSKIIQDRKDEILRIRYESALIAMQKKADSNNLKTSLAITTTQTEILGKYGYKLDSTSKILKKIVIDSSKTKIIVAEDPVLSLCFRNGIVLSEIRKETNREFQQYDINVCSNDASSANFKIFFQVAAWDTLNNLHYINKFDFVNIKTKMPKETQLTAGFNFTNTIPLSTIFVYVKGTYTNSDETKKFSINQLFAYNIKEKKFLGAVADKTGLPIIDYLNGQN